MGTLKIEINLPEFEKELSLNIIIKKDGEVVYDASSLDNNSGSNISDDIGEGIITKETPTKTSPKNSAPKKQKGGLGGNMMGVEF